MTDSKKLLIYFWAHFFIVESSASLPSQKYDLNIRKFLEELWGQFLENPPFKRNCGRIFVKTLGSSGGILGQIHGELEFLEKKSGKFLEIPSKEHLVKYSKKFWERFSE